MTRCELRKAAKEEEEEEEKKVRPPSPPSPPGRREVKFIVRRPSQFGTMTTHTHSPATGVAASLWVLFVQFIDMGGSSITPLWSSIRVTQVSFCFLGFE